MTAVSSQLASWPVIEAGDIDFSAATPVISAVQKFVVPVPEFADGGEPLIYPEGHEHAGDPVLAWDKSPIGETGVVFWNAKDSCWQAAAGDGTHVVIINDVSEREATVLHRRFSRLGGSGRTTHADFKDFLAYANSMGLTDTYQSDIDYVRAYMSPVKTDALKLEYRGVTMGFVKRDDSAIAHACYREGPFEFINAAGVTQEMPNGGVIVRLGDDIHAIQPDVFRQHYRLADHSEVRDCSADLERV